MDVANGAGCADVATVLGVDAARRWVWHLSDDVWAGGQMLASFEANEYRVTQHVAAGCERQPQSVWCADIRARRLRNNA